MTRREFSIRLRGELRGLEAAEIEKSVLFYDEMISDHMDEGMGEEEAVAAVGAAEEIAREILMEMPVTALVRRRVRRRGRLEGFAAVLIALGVPVWLPLVLTFVALILVAVLLAYLFVFLVGLVLWTAVLSVGAVAVGAILSISLSAEGLLYGGVALAGAGLAALMAAGVGPVTKLCVAAWRSMALLIKRLVLGRRNGNE